MGRQRRAAGVPAAASDAFLLVRVLVPALRLRLDKRLVVAEQAREQPHTAAAVDKAAAACVIRTRCTTTRGLHPANENYGFAIIGWKISPG